MASNRGYQVSQLSTPVTAMGIEHVHLSYLYLNRGDIDGYLSLLHADMSLSLPGITEIHGRERIGAFRAEPESAVGDHLIHHVIGSGDRIAVQGRFLFKDREGVDFTEVFELSDNGLLRSQKRYYFVPPR